MLAGFVADLPTFRAYQYDVLGWQPVELLSRCVPILLLAAVL